MTPVQIAALVGALIQLAPLIPLIMSWAENEITQNESLTDDEKAAFIKRIHDAQAMVPEWK